MDVSTIREALADEPDESIEEPDGLAARLGRVQSPTLLLWCRDDGVIDVSSVDGFRAGLRNSSTVLLDHCGHMPMMVKPDETAAALQSFVRRPMRVPSTQSLAAGPHRLR